MSSKVDQLVDNQSRQAGVPPDLQFQHKAFGYCAVIMIYNKVFRSSLNESLFLPAISNSLIEFPVVICSSCDVENNTASHIFMALD